MCAAKLPPRVTKSLPVELRVEEITFVAKDGWSISGTLFCPPPRLDEVNSAQPRGVLINSATGVTRSFYSRFATFIAQETGWPVLTYDYRGNVGILPDAKRKQLPKHPLVDIDADISDWAHLDQPAALEYLLAHLRSLPVEEDRTVSGAVLNSEVVIVGHSVGGHIAPLLSPRLAAFVPRVLFVSVNSAYFRHWQSKAPAAAYAYIRVALPILIAMHGYAPTQKLGLMFGELPSGVMEQWLRWTGHEDYCFSEPELKSVGQAWAGNVLGISFDDDEIARPSAFPGFSDMLKSAHVTNLHLKPSDVGLEGKIGHVGFFRSQAKEALWKPMLEFIVDKRVPASLLRKTALPAQTSRL